MFFSSLLLTLLTFECTCMNLNYYDGFCVFLVAEKKSRHLQYGNDLGWSNRAQWQPPTHSFTFQSSSVTYGGANGAYYTSSQSKRTGSNGVSVRNAISGISQSLLLLTSIRRQEKKAPSHFF